MNIRQSEKYVVNFARTENYRKTSVPYCQRLLNKHNMMEDEEGGEQENEEGGGHSQREGGGNQAPGEGGGFINTIAT